MSDLTVVDRTLLGRAVLPNGTQYDVVAYRHNRDWPGTISPITFGVEMWGWVNNVFMVKSAWGFFAEQECYQFLSSFGKRIYSSVDRDGNLVSDVRIGRGVPDAFISRLPESI